MKPSLRHVKGPLIANTFHYAPIGMALVGLDGRLMQANPALGRLLGYTQDELLELNILDITHPEDIYQDVMNIEMLMAGKSESYRMEKRYIHKDGQTIWALLHVSAVYEGGRQAQYFIGQVQDITELKTMMQQVSQLHTRNERVLNAMQEGIFGIDLDGITTFVNRAAAQMTGYTVEEIIGQHQHSFFHHTRADGSPYPVDECPLYATLRDGVGRNVNELFWRKDGTSFPVECWTDPITEDGEIVGAIVTFRDVTEKLLIEERLRTQQELYKLVTENSTDIIIYSTPDGICRFVSPSVYEQLGYTPEEVVGGQILAYYHPDEVQEIMKRSYKDIDIFTCRVRHKNGHYVWFETVFKQVRNAKGEVEKLIGVCRDITLRHTVEQELLSTKQELANILRLQQGITFKVKKLGDRYVYTMVEGELVYKVGLTPQKIVGKSADELLSPELRLFTRPLYDRAWGGEKVWYESGMFGVTYLNSLQPIMQNGEVVELLGSGIDISERIEAEKVLRESEERYSLLVESSTEAIAIVQDGRWMFINKRGMELFGADSREHIVGQSIYDFAPAPVRGHLRKQIERVLRQKETVLSEEQQWTARHGAVMVTEMVGIPVTFQGKASVQLLIRDISDRKQHEEWMLRSEKLSAAGQLAAGIAHEIRNPLTAIKGFFHLIRTQGVKPDYFPILAEEFDRIELILSELLVLAKPKEAEIAHCDLLVLLQHVVALLSSQAIMNNVSIVPDFPVEPIWIDCDENQIKQLFINLLKNAIEAMPKGGDVRIAAEVDRKLDQVRVRVIDQGLGIPPEQLSRIGQPFYSAKPNGTGLGLTISYRIVEQHGGGIDIHSVVDQGTTFEVNLPLPPGTK